MSTVPEGTTDDPAEGDISSLEMMNLPASVNADATGAGMTRTGSDGRNVLVRSTSSPRHGLGVEPSRSLPKDQLASRMQTLEEAESESSSDRGTRLKTEHRTATATSAIGRQAGVGYRGAHPPKHSSPTTDADSHGAWGN